jgi:hypothetical protein
MQVDGELQAGQSVGEQMQNRYYKGFVRGSLRIVREEGLAGLMKGAVPGTLRDATYSGMRIVSFRKINFFVLSRHLLFNSICMNHSKTY